MRVLGNFAGQDHVLKFATVGQEREIKANLGKNMHEQRGPTSRHAVYKHTR